MNPLCATAVVLHDKGVEGGWFPQRGRDEMEMLGL